MKLFELASLGDRDSVRFPLPRFEGFAVRDASGAVRAYLNVCPHRAQPVDVGDGRLWAASGEIECQAHGARFDPATGACTGGPCGGRALTPLAIEERDGAAWLLEPLEHG
jgi:nitrite reductase/ring-hydroxylating ferredoxin subunit